MKDQKLKNSYVPMVNLAANQYFGEKEILEFILTNNIKMTQINASSFQSMLPLRKSKAVALRECKIYKVEALKLWEILFDAGEDFFQLNNIRKQFREKQLASNI